MDKDLENAILKGANELDIAKIVRQKGMITMKEDAIIKSMNKLVPFEEVNML
jgi:type II secretory ATPase GspE/PulE/Tfp pilus assembly ATPase PilB-like protein